MKTVQLVIKNMKNNLPEDLKYMVAKKRDPH